MGDEIDPKEFEMLKTDIAMLLADISSLQTRLNDIEAQKNKAEGAGDDEEEIGADNYITDIIGPNVMREGSVVRIIDEPLPQPTTLYKVLAVREYDETTGQIVAVGSETGGSDRVKRWVADWARLHETP